MKRPFLLVAALLLLAGAGCSPNMMRGGLPPSLAKEDVNAIVEKWRDYDSWSRGRIEQELGSATLKPVLEKLRAGAKLQGEGEISGALQVAYLWERLGKFEPDKLREGRRFYRELSRSASPDASIASFRQGLLAERASKETKDAQERKELEGEARQAFERAANVAPQATAPMHRDELVPGANARLEWESVGSQLVVVKLRYVANSHLDTFFRGKTTYKFLDLLVRICGGRKSFSYGLALLLIAIIAKLVTTPLTAAQFRSMAKMQAVAPLLKQLQEKHKGEKETILREQMRLYKQHKVNPLGGCLPMLIQMPILIWVYWAIRQFVFRFEGASFLGIRNLAEPNLTLLALYIISMYFFSKLTTMPTADPQQQQMQKMMTIMMPFMFALMLQSLPAAFILYWLFSNILMSSHQYLIMRPQRRLALAGAPAGNGPGPNDPSPSSGGTALLPPSRSAPDPKLPLRPRGARRRKKRKR